LGCRAFCKPERGFSLHEGGTPNDVETALWTDHQYFIHRGNAGQANYAASKAAVIGLSKTVAREYAARGITVNVVAPGFIETDMTAALPEAIQTDLKKQIPQGKLGQPSDIADAVCFFASDQAAYVTGQVLHVNGGMYMGG